MIFPLAGILIGALTGLMRARSKGGNGKDKAHWAIVFGIIGGLLGLFVLIYLERSMR